MILYSTHEIEYEMERGDDLYIIDVEYTLENEPELAQIMSVKTYHDGQPFILTDDEESALDKFIYEKHGEY